MKTFAGMLSAAAVLLGCAWAQSPNTAAIEKQLIANERTINTVVMTRDLKTFRSLVARDGLGIDMTGLSTAADYEKMIADMKLASSNVEMPRVIWISPDVAIVAYTWTGEGTWQGQPIPSPTYASTTWVKQRDGNWLAKFHQESIAMSPKTTPTK